MLKIDNQKPIAAQYFGLYADTSDMGKNAGRTAAYLVYQISDIGRCRKFW